MMLEQWRCAVLVDWGFTFDSTDLDAPPLAFGEWKRSMSSVSLFNSNAACTVFWLPTEHGSGLNVTGVGELCTQHNADLWEWDSTPSSVNASIDFDVEKSQGVKWNYITSAQKNSQLLMLPLLDQQGREVPKKKGHVPHYWLFKQTNIDFREIFTKRMSLLSHMQQQDIMVHKSNLSFFVASASAAAALVCGQPTCCFKEPPWVTELPKDIREKTRGQKICKIWPGFTRITVSCEIITCIVKFCFQSHAPQSSYILLL